jgi:hypothetical protein
MGDLLVVNKWDTINYPEKKIGNAEIEIVPYSKGVYLMEGVRGYNFFELTHKIRVTTLKINGYTVMVDDPLHWIGMEELAKHSTGKVCVAGLGLGLVVHHLVKNTKVTEIDVFEINKDVIRLIKPLLPKDNRINIINDDFFKEPFRKKHYDTIIIDLWVGDNGNFEICGTGEKVPILTYYTRVKSNTPSSRVFLWGIRDKIANPAYQSTHSNT